MRRSAMQRSSMSTASWRDRCGIRPSRCKSGRYLHAGSNELKIVVANTAINELAGRAPADYRLLWLRYGKRFAPQDMDHLEPLPSGILGPLRIVPANEMTPSEGNSAP